MIDKIHMNTIIDIPIERLDNSSWVYKHLTPNGRDIEYYIHTYNHSLHILYKPSSHRLTIKGRLVSTSIQPDRVTNLDELLAGITEPRVHQDHSGTEVKYTLVNAYQNLDSLIESLNIYLSTLTGVSMNINDFKVTLIEICFNVITSHVEEYITIFNLIFDKEKPLRYINFVLEKKLPLESSYYVKGKAQYEKNKSQRYVINFYNKLDQLKNIIPKEIARYRNKEALVPFGLIDFIKADQVLRMEVQCYYKAIYEMTLGLSRDFNSFINIGSCYDIILHQYNLHIGYADLDFYSYQAAIDKITSSDLPIRQRDLLKVYLLKYIRNNTITDYAINRNRSILRRLGIHWFLIPTSMGIDYLESPMKILARQVNQTWEDIASYETRMTATQVEVDLHNSIETTEDSIITLPL